MASDDIEQTAAALPGAFTVAVILERTQSRTTWVDHHWEAVGVAAAIGTHATASGAQKIYGKSDVQRYLYPGYPLQLHIDECESYYHNLMSPQPRCFVVADVDEDGVPQPVLVSLSFDEAHAYLEGEDEVYSVNMPPEIYRWVEAFVLAHYLPTKREKRNLTDWKQGGDRGSPL
ncbi:MAG: DUF3305 domain-containing protein [Gammaproteobacteria bacterium]|nr:DUF3305 domain-containing protein [Gammaproteobacteria bacterium]